MKTAGQRIQRQFGGESFKLCYKEVEYVTKCLMVLRSSTIQIRLYMTHIIYGLNIHSSVYKCLKRD